MKKIALLIIFLNTISYAQNRDKCYNNSARIAMDYYNDKDISGAKEVLEDTENIICKEFGKPTDYFKQIKKKVYNYQAPVENTTVSSFSTFTETVNGVRFKMIAIAEGRFKMGSNDGDNSEKPVHNVNVPSFYMGETEVTQALWKAVMGNNPSYFKRRNLPVEQVSWNDAQTFIKKLNELTGKRYRLPSESEWEYAARGGNKSQGYTYAGSNTIEDVAWYWSNHKKVKTHSVGQKQPNELGLYDMSGNVHEWCEDKWHGSYEGAPTDGSAWTSGESSRRVLRGGGCSHIALYCRSAGRNDDSPGDSSATTVFG